MTHDSAPIPFVDSEDEEPGDPRTIAAINERFRRGSERMNRFEAALRDTNMLLDDNTELTRANMLLQKEQTAMTEDVHEVLMFAKSGILTLGKVGRGLARIAVWLRRAILWVAAPFGALVATYHAVKTWMHWGT